MYVQLLRTTLQFKYYDISHKNRSQGPLDYGKTIILAIRYDAADGGINLKKKCSTVKYGKVYNIQTGSTLTMDQYEDFKSKPT